MKEVVMYRMHNYENWLSPLNKYLSELKQELAHWTVGYQEAHCRCSINV